LAAPIPGSKIVVEKDWIVEISLGKFFFLIVFMQNASGSDIFVN